MILGTQEQSPYKRIHTEARWQSSEPSGIIPGGHTLLNNSSPNFPAELKGAKGSNSGIKDPLTMVPEALAQCVESPGLSRTPPGTQKPTLGMLCPWTNRGPICPVYHPNPQKLWHLALCPGDPQGVQSSHVACIWCMDNKVTEHQ
jgi:hypothetical protein